MSAQEHVGFNPRPANPIPKSQQTVFADNKYKYGIDSFVNLYSNGPIYMYMNF